MGADMSRNKNLAGQSVKQGGYTVTYDENGYATKSVKDGGKSATSSSKTTHANDSAAHQKAYQAAQSGDWDAAGKAVNEIAMSGGTNSDGSYDMRDANSYMQELQNEFGYNAKDYYNGLYDQAYGSGSASAFDTTGGAIKTIDQWNALTGGAAAPSQALTTGGNQTGITGGDASQYLQEMYAQQIAAQLAALKSTYEQNVADIRAQDDLITAAYDKQRNQAAAQNDLQRMYMNEMGLTQGLNTGATGQLALAQSAALQGNLATIGSQEAQSLADNALNLTKLTAQYKNAADQAAAEGNAQLASALYEEYVRQQQMAWQYQQAAQEQANWEAQFAYQQQANDRNYANTMAMTMLANGIMPDSDILKAAGISDSAAQSYQQLTAQQIAAELAYQQALTAAKNQTGSGGSSSGSSAGRSAVNNAPKSSAGVSITNSSGTTVTPLDYSTIVSNSEAGNYGPKYGLILGEIQAKFRNGADASAIADVISRALNSGDINEAGADTIMQALGY